MIDFIWLICAHVLIIWAWLLVETERTRILSLGQTAYFEKLYKRPSHVCLQTHGHTNGDRFISSESRRRVPSITHHYQPAVDSLMYVMLGTRPDIALPFRGIAFEPSPVFPIFYSLSFFLPSPPSGGSHFLLMHAQMPKSAPAPGGE